VAGERRCHNQVPAGTIDLKEVIDGDLLAEPTGTPPRVDHTVITYGRIT
jgi:hypothetical protein